MAIALKLTPLSKGMSSGEVSKWLRLPGDSLKAGEPLVEVMSEKANVEMESPGNGVLLKVLVPAGQEVPVGTVLCWIGEPGETFEEFKDTQRSNIDAMGQPEGVPVYKRVEASPTMKGQISSPASSEVKASPNVRRLASEHSIALTGIAGSGPGGLITEKDIELAIQEKNAASGNIHESVLAVDSNETERVALRGRRKIMAERMALSKQTTAAVTTVMDVDMGAIRALKSQLSITYTSVVVKAVGLALQQYPIINASLDGDDIVFHQRKHIGVAVDTPQGLIVVTVLDVDRKRIDQLDEELRKLCQLAKEGLINPKMVEGSSFTVTNSGVLGSLLFTPLINPPQAATLGMGKIQDMPVVRDGQIVIRPMIFLCLTYDHRFIEGAEAVRFLQSIKDHLENPNLLT